MISYNESYMLKEKEGMNVKTCYKFGNDSMKMFF